MTNILTFPTPISLDLNGEIRAIQNEAHVFLQMAKQLDRYEDSANPATNLAEDMEAVLARMTSAIEALKQKTKPFLKSQGQLDAEWRAFEAEFSK
jgi:hypothetical protein